MTLFRLGRLRHWTLVGLVAMSAIGPVASLAKTTGVAGDSALESGPCYQALIDKNAETPSTAPNRELGDACRVENGDVDKAWARVTRLWGSSSADVPDYESFVHADAPAPGTLPVWLAIVSIVLMYGVAATPMRAAAKLMRGGAGKAALAGEVVASLALRAAIALLLLALFSLPVTPLIGCVLMIALLMRELMLGRSVLTPSRPDTDAAPRARLSLFVAGVINDVAGGAVGLLGLALFANHGVGLLAGTALIALLLSVPPLLAARRFLRMLPIALTGMTAVLVVALAVYALNEPLVIALNAGSAYLGFAVPIILAVVTIAIGWRTWGAALIPFRT